MNRTMATANIIMPVVIVFIAIITVGSTIRRRIDDSMPLEGLIAVLSPVAAIGTAFGFLLIIGEPIGFIATYSPFIVLAIGVDDAFLMMRSLRQKAERSLSPEECIGRMLSEIGPSITLTSLTNALSFGVGALAASEGIRSFAVYTSVAVTADYFFQLTLFLSSLVLYTRRMEAGGYLAFSASFGARLQFSPAPLSEKSISYSDTPPFLVFPQKTPSQPRRSIRQIIWHGYLTLLVQWRGFAVGLVLLSVYLAASGYGLAGMRKSLADSNIFLQDSYYDVTFSAVFDHINPEGEPATILIGDPGDLRDPRRFQRLMDFVQELESGSGMIGKVSRDLFLEDFLDHVRFITEGTGGEPTPFCVYSLQSFLRMGSYKRWKAYIEMDEDKCENQTEAAYEEDPLCLNSNPGCLRRFIFQTGFRAKNPYHQSEVITGMRKTALKYGDLDITVYCDMGFYTDSFNALDSIAFETIMAAFAFMALVCLLLVPSLLCLLGTVAAMLSINLGVVGLFALGGGELDNTSICTFLMAIGFSVDSVSHISYHYKKEALRWSRLAEALGAILEPAILASITTIVGGSTGAIIIGGSIFVTFAKIIYLVNLLGLVHAVLFLPIFLPPFLDLAGESFHAKRLQLH